MRQDCRAIRIAMAIISTLRLTFKARWSNRLEQRSGSSLSGSYFFLSLSPFFFFCSGCGFDGHMQWVWL